MKKLFTILAAAAGITLAAPAVEPTVVAASTINESAKQNTYGGVIYLEQMLRQEGIVHNDFAAANSIDYRTGKPEGVVVHETATPGASAHNEAIYFNREWMHIYSYVHAFVDHTGVIQMTPPDHGVWGAGPVANNRFFQVELCEENNLADFAKSVNNDAVYIAQIMHQYGIVPTNASRDGNGTVWSHHAVSKFLGGTDHTDPDAYFAKWGYSMDEFCDLIKYYYDQQAAGSTIPAQPAPTTPATPAPPTTPTEQPALPAPVATKTLMHNAAIYDEQGAATIWPNKKLGTKLTIYGSKMIEGKKYLQVGQNQYVVASNVEGRQRLLRHNAFIYNSNGYRSAPGKLYRGNYVRTYGGRVKINGRKYYIINVNQFVKVGNFK